MKVHGVLFDLDGVLVSTDHYHYLAWKRIADKLDISFTPEMNNALRGVSRMESLDRLLGEASDQFDESQKRALADEKNAYYRESIGKLTPEAILPGVSDVLQCFKELKMPMGIGSSSKNAGLILERTGLRGDFEVVIDGTKIDRSKPDPEVFLKGASGLGLDPAGVLVFEDAEEGISAALNAGMIALKVGSPDPRAHLSIANMAAFPIINGE